MDNFIVGNGFVLDGVFYELEEKCRNWVVASYLEGNNIRCIHISNKEMKKAEPIPF